MPRARTTGNAGLVAEAAPADSPFLYDSPNGAGDSSGRGDGQYPHDVAQWFRAELASGAPWPRALLEAVGRWPLAEETHNGRRYKYIVGREAFDWLLLAERLCESAGDLIPARDVERLLFHGELPEIPEEDELREIMGAAKYRAYLNFHYGVVLEEALQLAAEETARKIHLSRGYSDSEELVENAFRHLYARSYTELLAEFRNEAHPGKRLVLTLHDVKEFTYWLHKRRVNYWDPARVASDTRLAICRLKALKETSPSRL